MLGDAEHPISFGFVPSHDGGPHVRVTVWAGHSGSGRGMAGTLTLRCEEWVALRELLARTEAAPGVGYAGLILVDLDVGIVHVDAAPFDIESIDPGGTSA